VTSSQISHIASKVFVLISNLIGITTVSLGRRLSIVNEILHSEIHEQFACANINDKRLC